MLNANKVDNYLSVIADRVEINRCPYCDKGMRIDTACYRECEKCGYSDSTNVPLKVKLTLVLHQDPNNTRDITVEAKEPDGKTSFTKDFVDIFTAEAYMQLIRPICL